MRRAAVLGGSAKCSQHQRIAIVTASCRQGRQDAAQSIEEREERLREAGLAETEIARLSSPIGLDLGARTPEETAISIAAEIIAGHDKRFDPVTIAAVCFTEPEIVSAGLGPLDVEGRDDVIQAVFPLAAIGRALAIEAGEDGGFVRVLASKSDHRLLGIQAVGQHVAELSNSFAQMLEMGAVLEDVAGVIHVHPTLGEAFHEASLRALGHAIHI